MQTSVFKKNEQLLQNSIWKNVSFWYLSSRTHISLCVLSPCWQNLVITWYCRLLYRCRHLSTWPYSQFVIPYRVSLQFLETKNLVIAISLPLLSRLETQILQSSALHTRHCINQIGFFFLGVSRWKPRVLKLIKIFKQSLNSYGLGENEQ